MRRLACVALLFGLCAGCVHGTKEGDVALSRMQAHRLASAIVRNTPEHIHFEPGTMFDWALLS